MSETNHPGTPCEACGKTGKKCHASCCCGDGVFCREHDHEGQFFLDALGILSGELDVSDRDYRRICWAITSALHPGVREAWEAGDAAKVQELLGITAVGILCPYVP